MTKSNSNQSNSLGLKGRTAFGFFLKACLLAGVSVMSIQIYFYKVADWDWIHAKFSAEPAPSLIIGSSRGLQGLQPVALNSSGLEFERPLYNFCFTGAAKFGPAYYRHVMAKVKPGTHNGLFLIEVNPLLLSTKNADSHAIESNFIEPETFIVSKVGSPGKTNYDYLLWHFQDSYYRPLFTKFFLNKGSMKVGDDGWLDAIIKPMDSLTHASRVTARVQGYKNDYFSGEVLSPLRLSYLKRISTELGQSGRVVLVRMPVSPEMLHAEEEFMPTFDSLMVSLASGLTIRYLNFVHSSMRDSTVDGSHIFPQSAKTLAGWIADSLTNSAPRASKE